MSDLKYWVWLAQCTGVRSRTRTLLSERFGGAREIYFSGEREYRELEFLEKAELDSLEDKSLDEAGRILDICADKDIGVVAFGDALYPRRLRNIFDPPAVLYVRGRLPMVDDEAAVAVIGTRSATPYGIKMGRRMGYELTKCGGLVVSGLTRGVDAAGAEGALRAGGCCLGVLGTAIDSDNEPLTRDAAAVGAVISEYPPGAETRASNFRARNRITAGVSVAVCVVEAPQRSGALLFVDEAIAQGREIFVVPANVDAASGRGSNALLLDGARPVAGGWDVLCDFEALFPDKLRRPGNVSIPQEEAPAADAASDTAKVPETGEGFVTLRAPSAKKVIDNENAVSYIDLKSRLEGLTEIQLKIISAIKSGGSHVDDIIADTEFQAAQVLSELTMLQIDGIVRQEAGKRFALNISTK